MITIHSIRDVNPAVATMENTIKLLKESAPDRTLTAQRIIAKQLTMEQLRSEHAERH